MGKGGYNGGSSIIRVSPGYVSTPGKKKSGQAPLTAKEKRARKLIELMRSGNVVTLEEAKSVGISLSLWKVWCAKNINIIEKDMKNCRSGIKALEAKLEKLRDLLKQHEGYRQAAHAKENDTEASGQ